jgi:hypothetical protein
MSAEGVQTLVQNTHNASALSIFVQRPAVVLFIYLVCVVPLGVYIFHDVLDARWRRVQNLHYFTVVYTLLFSVTVPLVVAYAILNIITGNYTEGGTSLVVAIVAINGGRKLFRLWQILRIHRSILEGPVTIAHRTLLGLLPRTRRAPGEGNYNFKIDYSTCFWKPHIACDTTREGLSRGSDADDSEAEGALDEDNQSMNGAENDTEPRGHYFSAFIFDDDFPGGDSSRLKFVNSRKPFFHRLPFLVREDVHECAMRLALYMRFALRPSRFEFWTTIVPTHKLITIRGHISIGKVLRRLINGGSDTGPLYVDHLRDDWDVGANYGHKVLRDPVQHLLRFATDKDLSKRTASDLKAVGTSLFWIAAQQNSDDTVTALSLFPKRWLRGARQNSRQLIFEISILLILAGHKIKKVRSRRELRATGFCNCSPDGDDLEAQDRSSTMRSSPSGSEDGKICQP